MINFTGGGVATLLGDELLIINARTTVMLASLSTGDLEGRPHTGATRYTNSTFMSFATISMPHCPLQIELLTNADTRACKACTCTVAHRYEYSQLQMLAYERTIKMCAYRYECYIVTH